LRVFCFLEQAKLAWAWEWKQKTTCALRIWGFYGCSGLLVRDAQADRRSESCILDPCLRRDDNSKHLEVKNVMCKSHLRLLCLLRITFWDAQADRRSESHCHHTSWPLIQKLNR
jgi:hypothetical protein